MEFGILLSNYKGCWEDAAFAERHGFSTAGFIDTPLIAGDPFVAMAMTANATSTMRLGTMLAIPRMRSAPATASAMSSINELAPGRVFFGIGTGYTSRLTFGLKPIGISRVVDYVHEVRQLLMGEEVVHRDGPHETHIRVASPTLVANNRENPVPIYLAADGPAALTATGEFADGWITTLQAALHGGGGIMINAPEVFEMSYAAIKSAAEASGRDFSNAHTSWTTAICVLEPGEPATSPRALQQVGPIGMFIFHTYACNPEVREMLPPPLREQIDIYDKEVLSKLDVPRDRLYQRIHEGHLNYLLDGEAAVLTDHIIRTMSLTGTAEEIAAQLRPMEAAGLKNLTLCIPPAVFQDVVLDVEKHIMPLLSSPGTAQPTTIPPKASSQSADHFAQSR